jgi:xylulokinase
MSDAAGTLWLDVGRRDWSDELLIACGLDRSHMPQLFEGTGITGLLDADLAGRWDMNKVPIAAGASDNAAGAIGAGIVAAGQAMLSLGTSGVYFTVSNGFHSNPQAAVHSFCHALPNTWHLMSVMLSAASCLDFACGITGHADVAEMLADAATQPMRADAPLFLPYLTGERTPHNDVNAQGVLFGLTPATRRVDIVHATLEGVGFGLLDGMRALEATGVVPDAVTVLGGGSRSAYWVQMLSDVMNRPLVRRAEGHVGPALGAARLARLAVRGEPLALVCAVPPEVQTHRPDIERHAMHAARHERFSHLYRSLVPVFERAR